MSADPVHARIDAAGTLTAADPALLELNARAGGRLGAPVAVPAIGAIVRLALRLRIVVSRAAVARDGQDDVGMWIRAEPDGEGVAVTITEWAARASPAPFAHVEEANDFGRAQADWHWATDDTLRLTGLSPAAAAAIGGDPRSLMGAPLTQLFGFAPDADGGMPVLNALAEHRAFDAQLATLRGAGTARYRLDAIPVMGARGAFAGFRGTATRVDDAVVTSATPGTSALEASAFAAQLDGALRGPLARIIANADDLQAQNEGPLRAEYAAYATDIAAAGRHLLSLVDDLVDLQAIERPDYRPERDELDLADLARRAAGLLAVRATAGRVRIARPPVIDRVEAVGEFRRVLQILVNLIGNAVRYSPPGNVVRVEAGQVAGFAAIAVTDMGKGIARDDHARIFDKFERIDPSEPGGTGLGLYIARRLARAMGGDIAVVSEPGKGASFTLTLPAA